LVLVFSIDVAPKRVGVGVAREARIGQKL